MDLEMLKLRQCPFRMQSSMILLPSLTLTEITDLSDVDTMHTVR